MSIEIQIKQLTPDNFRQDSLDGFIRHQDVRKCWRCENGEWQLQPIAFIEDWDASVRREKAGEICTRIVKGNVAYGAFENETVVGFAVLGERLGSAGQYIELLSFHVSEPYRGQGSGRRLFRSICNAARACGADKLYISAHSSQESQAAYRALGCVHAKEIDPVRAAEEPCDVQLEFDLCDAEMSLRNG